MGCNFLMENEMLTITEEVSEVEGIEPEAHIEEKYIESW